MAFSAPGAKTPGATIGVNGLAGNLGIAAAAIVTGFLGSGKTTLLSRLIRHPALARTAAIAFWGSRPTFFAVQRAVAGISCIRPEAPTCERASITNRLSWRIRPYT